MTLRGFATQNIWADDVSTAAAWYADLLGVQPYFERPGPEGRPAYVEFRIGDHHDELGIVDRRYQPPGATAGPGGVLVYWHVDDLEATVARLHELGAAEYQPITPRGDSGFVTASVVDPFGNLLGVMSNPHYVTTVATLGTL
jgi:predicted enzyme related to lactoylglutathione lyase